MLVQGLLSLFLVQVSAYPFYIDCTTLNINTGAHSGENAYTAVDVGKAGTTNFPALSTLGLGPSETTVTPSGTVTLTFSNAEGITLVHAPDGTFGSGSPVANTGGGVCTGTNKFQRMNAATSVVWTAPATPGDYVITGFSANAGMTGNFNRGQTTITVAAGPTAPPTTPPTGPTAPTTPPTAPTGSAGKLSLSILSVMFMFVNAL